MTGRHRRPGLTDAAQELTLLLLGSLSALSAVIAWIVITR